MRKTLWRLFAISSFKELSRQWLIVTLLVTAAGCNAVRVPGVLRLTGPSAAGAEVSLFGADVSYEAGSFIPGLTFKVEDETGRAMTDIVVTASLFSRGQTDAVLSGVLSATTGVDGNVRFTDLSVDRVGFDYAIKASIPGGPAQYSTLFNITPSYVDGTQSVLSAPSFVVIGQPFTLTLTAKDRFGNLNPTRIDSVILPGGAVLPPGGSTVTPGSIVNNGNGVYTLSFTTGDAAITHPAYPSSMSLDATIDLGAAPNDPLTGTPVAGVPQAATLTVGTISILVNDTAPATLSFDGVVSAPNLLAKPFGVDAHEFAIETASTPTFTPARTGGVPTACTIIGAASPSCTPTIDSVTCAITWTPGGNCGAYDLFTVTASNVTGAVSTVVSIQEISKSKHWTWHSGIGGTNVNVGHFEGAKGTSSALTVPYARARASSWKDATGNFWLFGGESQFGYLSSLMKWNGSVWTWIAGPSSANQFGVYGTINIAASANTPGARRGACAAGPDTSGNTYLFGGEGFGESGGIGVLNDLWKVSDTGVWTWLAGDKTVNAGRTSAPANGSPSARTGSSCWTNGTHFWLFAGLGYTNDGTVTYGYLNDVWKWDGSGWSRPGSLGNPGAVNVGNNTSPNSPGGRAFAAHWTANGKFWVFGGQGDGLTGSTVGELNDLWSLNWSGTPAWNAKHSGSNEIGATGVYATPYPGGRHSAAVASDGTTMWLYGGFGLGDNAGSGRLSDFWKLTGLSTTPVWEWMSSTQADLTTPDTASQAVSTSAFCGTLAVASRANHPGGGFGANAWLDNLGNFWLFGGNSHACKITPEASAEFELIGYSNDLFKYTY